MRRLLRNQPPPPSTPGDPLDRWIQHLNPGQTIATFAAIPGEVCLADLTTRHPQHRWVYPRVTGSSLRFHAVTHPATELQPGSHNIPEPPASADQVDVSAIDVFLCPGLAFDFRGGRLGRGGGFYDRMLAMARSDSLRIGVCSDTQLTHDTFAENHDVTMNDVIALPNAIT